MTGPSSQSHLLRYDWRPREPVEAYRLAVASSPAPDLRLTSLGWDVRRVRWDEWLELPDAQRRLVRWLGALGVEY